MRAGDQPRFRLHSEAGLTTIRRIRALAYLGLSSEDIWVSLSVDRDRLTATLTRMRASARKSGPNLEPLVRAIERTQVYLDSGRFPLEPVAPPDDQEKASPLLDDASGSSLTSQPPALVEAETARELDSAAKGAVINGHHRGFHLTRESTSLDWRWVCSERVRLVGRGADPSGPAALQWARARSGLLRQLAREVPVDDDDLETFRRALRQRPTDERLNGIAPPTTPEWVFTRKATMAYAAAESAACTSVLDSLDFVELVFALGEKVKPNRGPRSAGRADFR